MTTPVVSHDTNPTRTTYIDLTDAYDWFNNRLFDPPLPAALITFQRRSGSYGYFANKRFQNRAHTETVDEIALNPATFDKRSDNGILSTLVHEMVHLWQYHFGKPSRGGYHNKEWAAKMISVGLIPDNGNGRMTGQSVSHHIFNGGPFDRACTELLEAGAKIKYVDAWEERDITRKTRTKYTCPNCGANAWGKPDLHIDCRDCQLPMQSDIPAST